MTTYVTGIQLAHSIDGQFPDAVEDGQPEFAVVKSDNLIEVLTWLRDDPDHAYQFLSSLTGVDRIQWFAVVSHLESFKHNRAATLTLRRAAR